MPTSTVPASESHQALYWADFLQSIGIPDEAIAAVREHESKFVSDVYPLEDVRAEINGFVAASYKNGVFDGKLFTSCLDRLPMMLMYPCTLKCLFFQIVQKYDPLYWMFARASIDHYAKHLNTLHPDYHLLVPVKLDDGSSDFLVHSYLKKMILEEAEDSFAKLQSRLKSSECRAQKYRAKKKKESDFSSKLAIKLDGRREVKTKLGTIDVLTNTEIIEVKEPRGWKSAVGQVLAYSAEYPNHKKRIHLTDKRSQIANALEIESFCESLEIAVTYEG